MRVLNGFCSCFCLHILVLSSFLSSLSEGLWPENCKLWWTLSYQWCFIPTVGNLNKEKIGTRSVLLLWQIWLSIIRIVEIWSRKPIEYSDLSGEKCRWWSLGFWSFRGKLESILQTWLGLFNIWSKNLWFWAAGAEEPAVICKRQDLLKWNSSLGETINIGQLWLKKRVV